MSFDNEDGISLERMALYYNDHKETYYSQNVLPGEMLEIPAHTVVHGDATYMSIAAASVLAKTYRDDYMLRLHREYPQYGWDSNKGYPTAEHYEALRR